jgi:hypothetical protein
MAADIGESARYSVGAANYEDALAEKVERTPLAGPGDITGVADDLPRQ